MPSGPTADATLERFWVALSKHAATEGWRVGRETDGRSNRGFILERAGHELHFFVKLSQSERGFWGLSPERATEIIAGNREALILLTGPYEGYFVSPKQLRRLLPTFSRAAGHDEYKINEGKVAKEPRFTTIVRLWTYVHPLTQPSPPEG